MSEQSVIISRAEDNPAIAIVKINRPKHYNSLTVEVLEGLIDAAETIAADESVRAAILTGEGGFFSSGADFSLFSGALSEKNTTKSRIIGVKGAKMCDAWEAMPQPTFVAVEGGVVGGALAVAMACDFRVMSRDAYAYVPEVKMGVTFGWGSLPRLTNLVGAAKAKYMSIFCEKHSADECKEWGLVDFVTDNETTLQKAMTLAQKVVKFPTLPVQLIKRGVNVSANAIAKASGYADLEDLLLCMKDEEASIYRMETIKKLQEK